jgi:hypothetical protein
MNSTKGLLLDSCNGEYQNRYVVLDLRPKEGEAVDE